MHKVSIETRSITVIIDTEAMFTARIKRISAIFIMSALVAFISACAGGSGGGGGSSTSSTSNQVPDDDISKQVIVEDIRFTVTELYAVAGANYVTLIWNNPDAQIAGINIDYRNRTSNNEEVSLPIVRDNAIIAANQMVQYNISTLMPEEFYDFTVSLRLNGTDAGKEGDAASINNIRVNDDYDGDTINNFIDVDDDGDGLIEIATAQQLNQTRHNLSGSSFKSSAGAGGDTTGCGNGTMDGDITACNGYELITNISLAAYANWQPIGSCSNFQIYPELGVQHNYNDSGNTCAPITDLFNATFEGNNRTINDLTITNPAESDANGTGLFGAISPTSVLQNIHIRSAKISGGQNNAGLLVGYARRASIINSSASGEIAASGSHVGGLVGLGRSSIITSSYAAGGDVSGGGNAVGGLVGDGTSSIITSSYASGGDVSGSFYVGGLVGQGDGGGNGITIASSYASGGDVSGAAFVGGLVGHANIITITSSYASGGGVSGVTFVGGLVGEGRIGMISSSYAAGRDVSGTGNIGRVGGLVGVLAAGATITLSYAAGGDVSGTKDVGGLVGASVTTSAELGGYVNQHGNFVGGMYAETITLSYAAGGDVSGTSNVGGLVGLLQRSSISSSYAAGGSVSGDSSVGGLVGHLASESVTASYWNSDKSGIISLDDDSKGVSKTTQELQMRTNATGIYASWTDNCADGITPAWNFGTSSEYPALACTPNGFPPQKR